VISKTLTVDHTEPMSFSCDEPLAGMYKLSPFVWKQTMG